MMGKIKTHYDNLKVSRDAPDEVIRAAYKTLVQRHHPDKNSGDPKAAAIMAIINQSYEALSDPEKRRHHDEWIRAQEGGGEHVNARPTSRGPGVAMPAGGWARFADLPAACQAQLKDRVHDRAKDQFRAPLNGVFANYGWGGLMLLWFVYAAWSGVTEHWTEDSRSSFLTMAPIMGFFLAMNARAVYRWYRAPLRPSLIATPLYVLQTGVDDMRCWPLHEVANVGATDYLQNGVYQYTTMTMTLSGTPQTFRLRNKGNYEAFIARLRASLESIVDASESSDQAYVQRHDDFREASLAAAPPTKKNWAADIKLYSFSTIASLAFVGMAAAVSSTVPKPVYHAARPVPVPATTYSATPPAVPAAEAPREDYIAAKLGGLPVPSVSGYIAGVPKLNTSGYSTVTVDNSQNDSDVLVKLVFDSGSGWYPVREFYIRAGDQFMAENLAPGHYDVRYMERWTGHLAKSEAFDLEQRGTDSGVEYSTISMTLYKVAHGNMQTFDIGADEF